MQGNKVESKRLYSRLRRGMVFWYDPDPSVDKFNVPDITVGDRSIKDRLAYGKRPWVLVSSNDACIKSSIVQVCPIHNNPNQVFPNDVGFYFKNSESAIKCEQIRSINADELQEYDCILDDEVMERVDICLKRVLGIPDKETVVEKIVPTASMKQIEELIMGIVNKQVEEASKKVADNVQIDDAVVRISEGLSSLFDVVNTKTSNNVVVTSVPKNISNDDTPKVPLMPRNPKYRGGRTPVMCGTKKMSNIEIVRKRGERHEWSDSEMIEFMHDFNEYDADSLMKKYGCDTFKQLRDLKYNLGKKMEASNIGV